MRKSLHDARLSPWIATMQDATIDTYAIQPVDAAGARVFGVRDCSPVEIDVGFR